MASRTLLGGGKASENGVLCGSYLTAAMTSLTHLCGSALCGPAASALVTAFLAGKVYLFFCSESRFLKGQLHINSVKDMSLVGDTLLNAIKLYGDTVLKAQRFDQVNKDPSLLKPQTINVNVKNVLADLLKEAIQQGDAYSMIDKIRGASQQPILDADYTESEDEEIAESAELGGEEDE